MRARPARRHVTVTAASPVPRREKAIGGSSGAGPIAAVSWNERSFRSSGRRGDRGQPSRVSKEHRGHRDSRAALYFYGNGVGKVPVGVTFAGAAGTWPARVT